MRWRRADRRFSRRHHLRAIYALPIITRAVWLMHVHHDLGYEEIADRLSIDVQSVEAIIAEGLSMIRRHLEGEQMQRFTHEGADTHITRAEMQLRMRYEVWRCTQPPLRGLCRVFRALTGQGPVSFSRWLAIEAGLRP